MLGALRMPIPGRLRDRLPGIWMSKPTRGFCLLLAALSGCVTVGLYVHYRYVTASVVHEAEQQAWEQRQQEEENAPRDSG